MTERTRGFSTPVGRIDSLNVCPLRTPAKRPPATPRVSGTQGEASSPITKTLTAVWEVVKGSSVRRLPRFPRLFRRGANLYFQGIQHGLRAGGGADMHGHIDEMEPD